MVSVREGWRVAAPARIETIPGYAVEGDESRGAREAEAALLRAGKAGDAGAIERLLALHKRPLYALCRGMLGNADDADDAVQETFLRALRALAGFRGDAAFRSWLFRIAINVCLKWRVAHPVTAPWDDELAPISPGSDSPEALALRHLRLVEALGSLLPRHRAILVLKEGEGWSVAEIAAVMGWNEKRTYNELYKARRALVEWRRREAAEGDER